MIYLKKNDKLIILIAVVVIIIAAVGLAAYNPPDDDDINDAGGMKTYSVKWHMQPKNVNPENELYAGKNSKYSEDIQIDGENIANVKIAISWNDDSTYGILTTKGKDKLIAKISYEGNTETWESVKNGSEEFTFKINDRPSNDTMQAESDMDALEKTNQKHNVQDSLTFNIEVSVQPGEKIFRPLQFLKDKGNEFMLEITYEYYYAEIEEEDMMETGQANDDDYDNFDFNETDYGPAYLGMLVNAGLTRW